MASRKTTTRPAPDLTTGGATRVALYLRISTDEDHQPFSLGAQETRLAAFVTSQPGWEHVKTYTDQFSGAYAERPALQEALSDARLGLYDTLLVYRVDRFARSLKVLVGLLEELDTIGVAFRSATEPIDTSTATGRMLIQLLGVFAEFERATIIDRVVAGMERKAARGGWPGGSIPYGLELDEDHHLAVRESEFPIVKRIFTRYAIDKAGAVTIAAEFNEDGLRTRTGKRWSAKVILGILRNRGYLGEVSFRDVVYQADEPILDPILFDKAQALLDERGERYDRRFADTHPEYLLTGLITCARCHRHYVGVSAHGKRHRYRYYSCWTTQRYGKDACSGERLRADALEDAVLSALVDLYSDPELITRALKANQQTSATTARQQRDEMAATEAEIAKTEAAVDRYMHAFEAGTLTADIFADRVRDLGSKAKALRARHAELAVSAAQATAELPTIPEVEALRDQLRDVALHGPGRVRKAIAQAFVHSLTVEARDRILPKFQIRRGLSIENPSEHDGNPSQGSRGRGVRAMTPTVDQIGQNSNRKGSRVSLLVDQIGQNSNRKGSRVSLLVEVMGQLSNQNTFSRIMRLHDLVVNQRNHPPTDILPQELEFSQRRVRNRKLTRAQLEELIGDYQAGEILKVLASKYKMNRQSLSACLAREGVQRRYRVLDSQEQVASTVALYASGLSLVQVGRKLGVDRRSVRSVLLRAGVRIGDRHG